MVELAAAVMSRRKNDSAVCFFMIRSLLPPSSWPKLILDMTSGISEFRLLATLAYGFRFHQILADNRINHIYSMKISIFRQVIKVRVDAEAWVRHLKIKTKL